MSQPTKKLPKRSELDPRYTWDLEAIYENDSKWEEDFKRVSARISDITKYKGILAKASNNLLECLKLQDELGSSIDKIFVYAKMRKDEDNSNGTYQGFSDRAYSLQTDYFAAISFIVPEITDIPDETLEEFFNVSEGLCLYSHLINEILRQKKHILSETEEKILALASEMAHVPKNIFSMFNNADIKFPTIKDEAGNDVELTKGSYIKFLQSHNRDVRKNAYEAMYNTYSKHINTLSATLTGNIKCNKFFSGLRNYNSCLESSLDADNITVNVYDSLINTVNENLGLLHRYLKLRKKALKLDKLGMYDVYVPIVKEPEKYISYEEAVKIVEEGLQPLGTEYCNILKNGFNSRWIDVYENEGKTGGAYSWGSHSTHPYVLLNYNGTINDIFTIAHEMGHSLHSFYTNKTQPYVYSEYKIFVAEVASTVNEMILMRHLLEKTTSKSERAYLLNHYLEEFRGTVFRQVMFAEFEKNIHAVVERSEALTTSGLCAIYKELNEKYFGSEVFSDELIAYEWARIPHFYNSFYVYKYATGFSAATSISEKIHKNDPQALENYIKFLSGGGSNYPLDLLKIAGVDLSTPKPVQDALCVFENILKELEELI